MQAPKNGFFYVIDRETGELISAKNYVPVNWATHVDLETGRPVEIPEARWPGKAPYLQTPGPLGGHNWHPMSLVPRQASFTYQPKNSLAPISIMLTIVTKTGFGIQALTSLTARYLQTRIF